jgi:hypothetical protein
VIVVGFIVIGVRVCLSRRRGVFVMFVMFVIVIARGAMYVQRRRLDRQLQRRFLLNRMFMRVRMRMLFLRMAVRMQEHGIARLLPQDPASREGDRDQGDAAE